MFIRNCMTPRSALATVSLNATVQETLDLLEQQGLDSAPVVDDQDGWQESPGTKPFSDPFATAEGMGDFFSQSTDCATGGADSITRSGQ